MKILLIALAGAVGTLARYWFSGLVQRASGGGFPWGTFAANMAGCLLFGFVWSLAEERMLISTGARSIVLVGFMGAFTTYSTYTFETAQFLRDSEWALAAGNIALQNTTGIVFLLLGLALGRLL
ncbi:MAG: fluoride efflux transporter FluC [Thermodesulfobacteriota bacterium]